MVAQGILLLEPWLGAHSRVPLLSWSPGEPAQEGTVLGRRVPTLATVSEGAFAGLTAKL